MNNIILLLNEFPKLSAFGTLDVINGIGTTGYHPSEFSGKPHRDEVLTTNHISINSRILTRLYLSANASDGHLNKMLIFNNVVVILDGIVTNESEFLKKSSINHAGSFSEFIGKNMTIELLIIQLYCKYGFRATVNMLEGNFSLIIIDKRMDDVIDNTCGFRKTSTRENTVRVAEMLTNNSLSCFPEPDSSFLSAIKHEPKKSERHHFKSVGSSSSSNCRESGGAEYGKDCEDMVGSKIYISREKSGTTALFMIIVSKDNSESFLITNNYSSVVKTERELNERNYDFSTFKINSGCYTVLTHGHLVFSKWKINNMNHPYYINPHVEKFGGITDEYVKTYGRQLYECISDSVGNTLKAEKNVGCLITNTVESRIIFEYLKKYYTVNDVSVPFYAYSVVFEEPATSVKRGYLPSVYSVNEIKHTCIHTNIVIPSIHSVDMKPTIISVINNMVNLYPCDFMEKFLGDRIIQDLISPDSAIPENHASRMDKNILTGANTDTELPSQHRKQIYLNTEKTTDPEYYLNVLKTNIGYFYVSEHVSKSMPTIKSLFLTGGSRFIFNSFTQKTAMFDKIDYDNYCKSYITNMDSNEGLRANLYLFSKNIRAVYPFSDKRITDLFFGLSSEVRYEILSTVGVVGNTLLSFMEHGRIADGDMINVKTPDGFFDDDKSIYIPCKIPYNNADDIVY